MAKRASLIKRTKPKIIRFTKSEQYVVNSKYLGDEPTFENPELSQLEYNKALNWYNYMMITSDARQYLEEFFHEYNRPNDIKSLSNITDNWIPTTAAWISRLMRRGYILPDSAYVFFENRLTEAFRQKTDSFYNDNIVEIVKSNPQISIKDRAQDIISDIETLIDSNEKFSLFEWLKAKELPPIYASHIIEYYTYWLDELLQASEGLDEQLVEAYSHMTKKQLNARIIYFGNMLEEADRYSTVTKKVKKPTTKKPVSVEKQLKSFSYQKSDIEYNITSVNPEKLIGSQELWTFNTRYGILSIFKANDSKGLQIKGTTIINYDPVTSCSKRTGRKSQDIVNKVKSSGKIALRKIMDELTINASIGHRCGENTILLRLV